MDQSLLPKSAFIGPRGENQGAVEQLTKQFMSTVLDHLKNAYERSPLPQSDYFPDSTGIPEKPIPEEEILKQLKHILTGSMLTRPMGVH